MAGKGREKVERRLNRGVEEEVEEGGLATEGVSEEGGVLRGIMVLFVKHVHLQKEGGAGKMISRDGMEVE